MLELQQRVNPKQSLIGWYSTKSSTDEEIALLTHTAATVVSAMAGTEIVPQLVFLTLAPEVQQARMHMECYTSLVCAGNVGIVLHQLPCALKATSIGEQIASKCNLRPD